MWRVEFSVGPARRRSTEPCCQSLASCTDPVSSGGMSQHNTFLYVDLGVEVIELSPTEWSVTDARRPDHGDGLSLIGYIRQTEAGFETTELGMPRPHNRFPTFPEALTTLSQRRRPHVADPTT